LSDYLVKATHNREYWTNERCYITEICNTPMIENGSLAIIRVAPGVTTQLHALTDVTETYIVIEGIGEMEVDGDLFMIGVGDQVLIPAGTPQRVTAQGQGALRFYCLCTPRFHPEAYVNLESK
jgi:mannose-6-phosphate isomerase-like protein (cupin superfamily)